MDFKYKAAKKPKLDGDVAVSRAAAVAQFCDASEQSAASRSEAAHANASGLPVLRAASALGVLAGSNCHNSQGRDARDDTELAATVNVRPQTHSNVSETVAPVHGAQAPLNDIADDVQIVSVQLVNDPVLRHRNYLYKRALEESWRPAAAVTEESSAPVDVKQEAPDFDEQYRILLDLFPDAEPGYMHQQCERLLDSPAAFQQFVNESLELRNYPTREAHLRQLKLTAQQKQYTAEFSVQRFLEVIPEPEKHFGDAARVPALQLAAATPADVQFAMLFLSNRYSGVSLRIICAVFAEHSHDVVKAAAALDFFKPKLHNKRRVYPISTCSNIPLLQEIAYVAHKREIHAYIAQQRDAKEAARRRAKKLGLLAACDCCCDDEVLPEETAACTLGHAFCRPCIRQHCEVLIGQGRLSFPCLTQCAGEFALHVLQATLAPKVFSRLAQRKQLEEVKAAGIEELELCPFCDFATIPAPGDKLFRCLNTECMKESCRQCREPSHIPLRCDEVEKDEDVRKRTFIEDKMTEALVRVCPKCDVKFVKEDGCNKMTCQCGASMCYVCNEPVADYKHFNGQGGDNYGLCPLYSDTAQLHLEQVRRGAQQAKQQLGLDEAAHLKLDPTHGLESYFQRHAD